MSAASIIRQHYGLDRPVTRQEVVDEIASLVRKHASGSMDDMDESLYYRLEVAGYIVDGYNSKGAIMLRTVTVG